MKEIKAKIKRIKPLIKIRKNKVDKASFELLQISTDKDRLQKELHNLQMQYLEYVQKLNKERQSSDRKNLILLEQNVDYLKQKWIQTLYRLKNLEKREQEQMEILLQSKKDLNVIEKLQEKYQQQVAINIATEEQKTIDQIAIRRFMDDEHNQ